MKSTDGRQNICGGNQDKKLSHNRYDHTENSLSQCLEYSSCNDAEPRDQIMDTNDPKCRNTDGKHIIGGIEHSQESFWYELIRQKANKGKAEGNEHADLDRLDHTLFVPGTVIISDDWCNTVIKTKHRHKEDALQFKINAKYCSCSNRKLYQDQIHRISHDGADGLHNDGGNTYCVNMTDNCFIRAEASEIKTDLRIKLMVSDPGNNAGHKLPDHCGNSSSCNSHSRCTQKTKDQDRVQDNVGECTT